MAEFCIFESHTAIVGGAEVSLIGGSVINDGDYNIPALFAAGFKMVQLNLGGGDLVNVVMLTGAGSYTPSAGITSIYVEVVGGGGGSGGATFSSPNGAWAGGGGGGGYAAKFFVDCGAGPFAYACGAGGAGGVAGGAGNNGDPTTFTGPGAVVVTGDGGLAANGMAAGAGVAIAAGGGTASSSNGDINAGGQPSTPGIRLSGTVGLSGNGGSTPFGAGGSGRTNGNGIQGLGFGAGGGGGGAGSANRTGANGTAGCIRVTEYR